MGRPGFLEGSRKPCVSRKLLETEFPLIQKRKEQQNILSCRGAPESTTRVDVDGDDSVCARVDLTNFLHVFSSAWRSMGSERFVAGHVATALDRVGHVPEGRKLARLQRDIHPLDCVRRDAVNVALGSDRWVAENRHDLARHLEGSGERHVGGELDDAGVGVVDDQRVVLEVNHVPTLDDPPREAVEAGTMRHAEMGRVEAVLAVNHEERIRRTDDDIVTLLLLETLDVGRLATARDARHENDVHDVTS